MANVVVKTIWQSKEINEAGDPPSGVETRAQSTRDLLGKAGPKAFPKKKKAVSFHGVEPPQANEAPSGHLNLKRSSACTNVSLLNLTGDDSESTDDGAGRGAAPLSLPLPSGDPAWSEDDTDPPTPLDMVNSGLVRAKDSVTSLKERASRVNRRVQSLQSECSMLCDNLERRRREAEDLEKYCTQLQESCHKVSQSVEDAEIKTNALKKSSVLLEVRSCTLTQFTRSGQELPSSPGAACGTPWQRLSGSPRTQLSPSAPLQGEAPRPGPPPRPAQLPAGPAVPGWGAPAAGAAPAALTPTAATNKAPALALGLRLRPCVCVSLRGEGAAAQGSAVGYAMRSRADIFRGGGI
uniref:Uncharacterized protein n=1 Tax=Gopherus agassizii TaxID=38772 RepID=A0A452J650_9SAUR